MAAYAALAGYETLHIKAVRTDRFEAADRHPLVDVNVDLAPLPTAVSAVTGRRLC